MHYLEITLPTFQKGLVKKALLGFAGSSRRSLCFCGAHSFPCDKDGVTDIFFWYLKHELK